MSPASILLALPEGLRGAFVALPARYGVALEHRDNRGSSNHVAEDLHDAARILGGTYRCDRAGMRIEVYGPRVTAVPAPEQDEERCEDCHAPTPATCQCVVREVA